MKVFSCPDEAASPEIDYSNGFDTEKIKAQYDAHIEKLKVWLVEQGYDGEYTGCIARFPVADGYAQYMMGDGPKPILIHLDHWDGWHYQHIKHLPRSEVVKVIERDMRIAALFDKKAS